MSSTVLTDLTDAELTEWERSKIGDRLASFGVLLPAEPDGVVVLALDPQIADVLRNRYSSAVVLTRPEDVRWDECDEPTIRDAVLWDGRHSPLAAGSAALVVADRSRVDTDSLRSAVRKGGTLAILGEHGEFVIYPNAEHPEQVWHRRWPVPAQRDVRAQLRRSIGIRANQRRGAPRLRLEGPPRTSLADAVVEDLTAKTGRPGRLVGVTTAGHTILRVRQPDGDVAVRLSLSRPGHPITVGESVAADVPAVAHLVQRVLARGTTCGCPWVATTWLPRRRRPFLDLFFGERRRWQVAEELASCLATVETGRTGLGWARDWCDAAVLLPAEARERITDAMAVLDGDLPTGWCHGDPWAANIVLDRDGAAVIDWENATPDAPLGLDWLSIAVLQQSKANGGSFALGCLQVLDGSIEVTHPIAGRPFAQWSEHHRRAFVLAAFVLNLRNRSLHDLGTERLRDEVDLILRALDPADEHAVPTAGFGANAGRAARGAVWLALSAGVVKGSQIVILLVLAALLPPSALGLVAVGTLVTNVSQVLCDVGTSSALIYWRGDARRAARSALTLAVTLNFVVGAAVWLAAPWIVRSLHVTPDGVWLIRGLVCALPFYGAAATTLELLRRELAFVRRIIPDIVAAVAGSSVAVVLALQGHGVASLVVGQIVQGVLTLTVAWLVGGVVRPGWSTADVRKLATYGIHLSAANLFQLVLLNVDYVIVARVLGETDLGEYSLAFRLAYLPFLNVAFVIAGAAFPYFCRLPEGSVGPALERVTALAMMVLTPVCLAIALNAEQLQLLGESWRPAVDAVRWLALYAAILSLCQFTQTALNSVGRPRATMLLQLSHLLILIVLLSVLARYGITAVAIGQVIAVLFKAIAALAVARVRLPGLRLGRLTAALVPVAAGGACMTITVLALHHVLPSTVVSSTGLGTALALGVAAFAIPVLMLDRPNIRRITRLIASPS